MVPEAVGSQPSTHSPDGGTPVSAAQVRRQLERILASESFARADRPRRFLTFLVEHVLDGAVDKINEYVLAAEVFNRNASFRPDSDPIVRVEAGRLRKRLRGYYDSDGRYDPVVIELPQRTYVPVFRLRPAPEPEIVPALVPVVPGGRRRLGAVLTTTGLLALLALAVFVRTLMENRKPDSRSVAAASATPSLAVLPFADISPGQDQEHLCDGLTDELIEALAKLKGLRVVSRTSSFAFKGRREDVRSIGARLNAEMVLDGSVRRVGDTVRVKANLVNVSDGFHIWTRTYERPVKDLFAIQQELARTIANTLRAELADAHWLRPPEQYAPPAEAYIHYLKGLHFERQWNNDAVRKSIAHFEEAIRMDPNFAPAYAQLAGAYCTLGAYAVLPPKEAMGKAKAAAEKALALDPTLPHAHAALALEKALYEWDWESAGKGFRRAHELESGDTDLHEWYVIRYLIPARQFDLALAEARKMENLDPISPRVSLVLGLVHYYRREFDRAIEKFGASLELDPHFAAAHMALAAAYEQKSMFPEAVAAVQKGRAVWHSGLGRASLGHIYGLMRRRKEAEALAAGLVTASSSEYISPFFVCLVHLGSGNDSAAIDWLEKAYAERSPMLADIHVNPRFDRLRSDRRFTALSKKIRLE